MHDLLPFAVVLAAAIAAVMRGTARGPTDERAPVRVRRSDRR
jgi:hypothetical protein